MKLKRGAWDGAHPRTHVLKVLKERGVEVSRIDDSVDYYLLVDADGDPHVQHIPNPVVSEVIVALYRRFGALHGFLITDLASKKPYH